MLNKLEGADASADALPSIAALREQLKETRQRLDVLQAERASLAIPALSRKSYAIKRIVEIDAERSELASHVETIEQAIVSARQLDPDQEKRFRILDAFERDFDRRSKLLDAVLVEKVSTFAKHVRQHLDREDLNTASKVWAGKLHDQNFGIRTAAQLGTVEDIFNRMLREAALDLCRVQDAEIRPGIFSDVQKAEQRKAAGIAVRDQMVERLMATQAMRPPAHLVEVHAAFHDKLAHMDAERIKQAKFDENQRTKSDPFERRRARGS